MPSKLDPHIAAIENWPAAEPQLTALAIVSRLSDKYPEQFGKKQHSIVQRLLKSLRNQAAKKLFTLPGATTTGTLSPGSVDGSGYGGPDPSTALSPTLASKVLTRHGSVDLGPGRTLTLCPVQTSLPMLTRVILVDPIIGTGVVLELMNGEPIGRVVERIDGRARSISSNVIGSTVTISNLTSAATRPSRRVLQAEHYRYRTRYEPRRSPDRSCPS
jgi:hypothetical protein